MIVVLTSDLLFTSLLPHNYLLVHSVHGGELRKVTEDFQNEM